MFLKISFLISVATLVCMSIQQTVGASASELTVEQLLAHLCSLDPHSCGNSIEDPIVDKAPKDIKPVEGEEQKNALDSKPNPNLNQNKRKNANRKNLVCEIELDSEDEGKDFEVEIYEFNRASRPIRGFPALNNSDRLRRQTNRNRRNRSKFQ